jgi:hypothetical protein
VLLAKIQVVPIFGFATRHAHTIVAHERLSLGKETLGLELNAKVRVLDVLPWLHEFQETTDHVLFANIAKGRSRVEKLAVGIECTEALWHAP